MDSALSHVLLKQSVRNIHGLLNKLIRTRSLIDHSKDLGVKSLFKTRVTQTDRIGHSKS
jgi:hypothetical protein